MAYFVLRPLQSLLPGSPIKTVLLFETISIDGNVLFHRNAAHSPRVDF